MNGIECASDSALAVAVADRDQRALAELYRRHSGSVFRVARSVLQERIVAEDVVQDVFTRLWQGRLCHDPARGSIPALLRTQAHSRALDIARSESARRRRERKVANAFRAPYVLEDEAARRAEGEKVRQFVGALSNAEREAISLAYFGGHTYAAVATLLGVAEGTVKSRIRSGLARLRTTLVDADVDRVVPDPVIG